MPGGFERMGADIRPFVATLCDEKTVWVPKLDVILLCLLPPNLYDSAASTCLGCCTMKLAKRATSS